MVKQTDAERLKALAAQVREKYELIYTTLLDRAYSEFIEEATKKVKETGHTTFTHRMDRNVYISIVDRLRKRLEENGFRIKNLRTSVPDNKIEIEVAF